MFTSAAERSSDPVVGSSALFGLITLRHLWWIVDEWPRLATDYWYLLLTVAAAALCLWAWRLLRLSEPNR
jgi:hypothetical protein